MAVRARPDNLSIDHPADSGAPRLDLAEVWELRDELRTVCRRMVGDADGADDVVQETFLRALTNAEHLDRRRSYAPWLATVARRRSIDEIRSRTRVRPIAAMPESAGDDRADPLEHVLRQEAIDRVRAALRELRPRERQLLLRQVTHGLSLAELAEEEGASVASVRSVLMRARTKLRVAVERDGPLGAAPVPGLGLVAAVKRRLHRWASRLDGHAPFLAGAGAQFGDAVVAVAVAAVALLLSGNVPHAEPPAVVVAASASGDADGSGGGSSSSKASGGGFTGDEEPAAKPATTTTTTETPPTTVVPSPSQFVDLPNRRDPQAAQPDVTNLDSFAASADGSTVLAAGISTTQGTFPIYRSNDGGHTWQRLETDGYTGGRLLVPPSYPHDPTIFAASESGFLLRSNDGGKFFWPVAPLAGNAAALVPGYGPGNRRVLVATPALAEYDVDADRLSFLGAGPEVAEFGGLTPTSGYSTDGTVLVGGRTRSALGSWGAVFRCSRRALDPCDRVLLQGSAAAPEIHVSSIPGVVLAHAVDTLYRSADGGNTFSPVALPAGFDVEQIVDGAPGELLMAGTRFDPSLPGSGLMRSTDNGITWTPVGTATRLVDGAKTVIRLANGHILGAVTPFGGLLCTADNGGTWAPRCPAPTTRRKD